ncbi:MAG TPA: hypothetical protein V6C97_27515 [Oculatellaceae cyanobacterium]
MPTNEWLAPSKIVILYTTQSLAQHRMTLYFDAVPVDTGGYIFNFPTYTDAGHATGWTVVQIVTAIFARMALSATPVCDPTINAVEVWQSVPSGANIFLGYDAGDYTAVAGGAGGVASGYVMWFFQTNARDKFTLTVFDSGDANPQRTSAIPTPTVDNTFLDWFILKSAVHFTNNDGIRLSRAVSYNWGYNRKLARSYGKTVTP